MTFGRSIKSFDCRFESYGWSGRIALEIANKKENDAVFEGFQTDEVITIRFAFEPLYATNERGDVEALTLGGLVTSRSFEEYDYAEQDTDLQISSRRLIFEFVIRHYLWSRHFPIQLYTKSLSDIIADHGFEDYFSVVINVPAFDEVQPQVMVATAENRSSFWDYVQWVVRVWRHLLVRLSI